MRILNIFLVSLVLLIQLPAYAEDVPTNNWNGIYTGIDVGARYDISRWHSLTLGSLASAALDLPENPVDFDALSLYGDIFAGYNFPLSETWVIGFEADIGEGGGHASKAGIPGTTDVSGLGAAALDRTSVETGMDGSARLRLGYVISPDIMIYGTGGVAWQEITAETHCLEDSFGGGGWCAFTGFGQTPAREERISSTRMGFTLGAGGEYMLNENWNLRSEYRYGKYSELDNHLFLDQDVTDQMNIELGNQSHVAKIGVVYKF